MKDRNIFLIYLVTFARYSWFWMGIWVFYYLRFTNYSGVGLLETVLFFTSVVSEIPTGAIADLLGKKFTIILSLIVLSISQFIMAVSPVFLGLIISCFVAGIGIALFSGTMEAYLYDYLIERKQENNYDKYFSKIQTIQLITLTFCTIVGGYLYSKSPVLPFYLNGIFLMLGALTSCFLAKPSSDNQKFSLNNFISQTQQGFRELFCLSVDFKKKIYLLLSIGCIFAVSTQSLDSILGIEFGFDNKSLSLLTAAMLLIASFTVQLVPKLRHKLGNINSIFLVGLIGVIIYTVAPFITIYVGGLTLILRQMSDSFFENLSSTVINNSVPSKFRATSISTFNMIKELPYALTAFFIGGLMDMITARNFALILGILLFALLITNYCSLQDKKQFN